MVFVSTRGQAPPASFAETVFQGLAPDGGLYVPSSTPDLKDFFHSLSDAVSFADLGAAFASEFLQPEISSQTAEIIARDAFGFEPRVVHAAPGIDVLELFHGPSCAFKDFGASFLASAMNHLLSKDGNKTIIITATSGDTGSAVAQAFYGKENIEVIILYPSGKVSPLQEKQLTTLGGNITAIEVAGVFDDCQRMAKSAFKNPQLSALPLSSANSINFGRLFPQSFYYVWAWTRHRSSNFTFVVPSGNFGNITAGLYAEAWGLPVQNFVAATNSNDVIPEYLRSGLYQPKASIQTLSNAMDVGNPSNYERLCSLYHQNLEEFRNHVTAFSVDDDVTMDTIDRVYRNYNYLCCPHTAVAWRAAELYREKTGKPAILLSTAHPAKFLETVETATGKSPAIPPPIAESARKQKRSVPMTNRNEDFHTWLLGRFR